MNKLWRDDSIADMAIPRFYCPVSLVSGTAVELPEPAVRHAIGALRLRDGDALALFDGQGVECIGTLQRDGKHLLAVLTSCTTLSRESPLSVTLVQGISSGERMDYTLQKAVELGVARIVPVFMKRSIVRLTDERLTRRHAHWQAVVVAACEQCGRNHTPEVMAPTDFFNWLPTHPPGLTVLLDPEEKRGLRDLSPPTGPVTLLAGPEGGFELNERKAALAAGATGIRLGPRVLRTETAAVAALAAMQVLWGDF